MPKSTAVAEGDPGGCLFGAECDLQADGNVETGEGSIASLSPHDQSSWQVMAVTLVVKRKLADKQRSDTQCFRMRCCWEY